MQSIHTYTRKTNKTNINMNAHTQTQNSHTSVYIDKRTLTTTRLTFLTNARVGSMEATELTRTSRVRERNTNVTRLDTQNVCVVCICVYIYIFFYRWYPDAYTTTLLDLIYIWRMMRAIFYYYFFYFFGLYN